MKTRFDSKVDWITGEGMTVKISDLETSHLMNIVRMFIKKPFVVTAMLVHDIEDQHVCDTSEVWSPKVSKSCDVKKESIFNITSMSEEEVIEYALASPLGKSIIEELSKRGVNTKNFIELISESCC